MFACRLCGCRESRPIKATDAKDRRPLGIAFCSRCGLVQQSRLPDAQDLRIYYAHSYRRDYKGVHTPKLKHVRRAGIAALSREELLQARTVSWKWKRRAVW